MTIINNISINHNKDYDHDKNDLWTYDYLITNIFNDFMNCGSKYIYQAVEKFKDFRRNSTVTYFYIDKKDFSSETKKRILKWLENCKTEEEEKDTLDGLMTEAIALIFKQAEPLILSDAKRQDHALVKRAINEIRIDVSKKWRLI